MLIKTKIEFIYENEEYAQIAFKSLYPDNENYIESYVEKNKLICLIKNENISTVLNTFEDLIQCEKIIESTSEII